jgi:acyl dehydratase
MMTAHPDVREGDGAPMTETEFSPEGHRLAPPKYFDDLAVGERFYIPSRTMTEALFAAFQLASADNHPIHYDRVYCQAHGHRDLLAHGLLVAAQAAAGAGIFPHVIGDSLIAFLDQSSRFLRPVYVGDTLYPMLTITELRPGRTTGVVVMKATIHNQTRELVMDGEHRYLLRKHAPRP